MLFRTIISIHGRARCHWYERRSTDVNASTQSNPHRCHGFEDHEYGIEYNIFQMETTLQNSRVNRVFRSGPPSIVVFQHKSTITWKQFFKPFVHLRTIQRTLVLSIFISNFDCRPALCLKPRLKYRTVPWGAKGAWAPGVFLGDVKQVHRNDLIIHPINCF